LPFSKTHYNTLTFLKALEQMTPAMLEEERWEPSRTSRSRKTSWTK